MSLKIHFPLHAEPGWKGRVNLSNSTQLQQRALRPAGLALLLTALLLVGCATPSRFYTTRYSGNDPDPLLCDTFRLGQDTWVVVQGFEGIKEVILEVSSDGKLLSRKSFPLTSGQARETLETPTAVSSGPWGIQGQMHYNLGDKINLGVVPAGVYDLALKTNNVLAALAHFKVVMPARLENEHQAMEVDRKKLQEAADSLKQLKAELDHEASVLDRSNAALVSDFNNKVQHYNEMVAKAKADQQQFNARVRAYNTELSRYGLKTQNTEAVPKL